MVVKRKINVAVLKAQVLKAHSRGFRAQNICSIINTMNGPFDQVTKAVSYRNLKIYLLS